MDRLAFYAQRKGITAKTTPGDFNHLQDHIEAAIKAAIKDTFPVPAVLSATDMAVTASVPADWNVNISAGPGYDEYGGRVYNPLAALLDVGPTAYANPAAGNEYYLRVVARADRTESAPRVTATGGTENFHEADAVELTCIQGVEALIGAAVVPAALAGDITLAVVRRFAGQANVAAGDIATTLRDELATFLRISDMSQTATALKLVQRDASGDALARVLKSNVAVGTAPLSVVSTTQVPNLYAARAALADAATLADAAKGDTRFQVSGSTGISDSASINSGSSKPCHSIRVAIPVGKSLILKRIRFSVVGSANFRLDVYINAASVWSSAGANGEESPNAVLSAGGATVSCQVLVRNTDAAAQVVTGGSGWWLDLAIE